MQGYCDPARANKQNPMYKLIKNISERCYTAAEKRGKDISCLGCIESLAGELTEYWKAVDQGKRIEDPSYTKIAEVLSGDEFVEYYNQHLHNTDSDELADILIVAATWVHSAKIADGPETDLDRTIDMMFANGAIQFVCNHVFSDGNEVEALENLRSVISLKMLYNEARND